MRAMVVATAVCFTIVGWAAAQDASAAIRHPTQIPPQPLDHALKTLANDRGFQVLYLTSVVGDVRTGGASGELTAAEALAQLLSGTGFTFKYLDDKTVTIVPSGGPVAVSPEGNSEAVKLEEIIVTATKRAERLVDVPMSISVISSQDIERRGLIGMEDYLRSVPGVSQIDRGALGNAIVIRGITTTPQGENFFSGTTVSTYFDETPITGAGGLGAGGIDVRPVDIERIEVLRGPQGTSYGSSSLGGTVRMISAKPRLNGFEGKVAGSYSSTSGEGGDNTMIQGVANIPLVTDKLAIRAVGYRYDESGYYRNVAGSDPATIAAVEAYGLRSYLGNHAQDDVGQMISTGGRLAALWQATDQLSFTLTHLTQKIEQDGSPSAGGIGKYEQANLPIVPQGRVRGEIGWVADTQMDLSNLVMSYDFDAAALTTSVSWIDAEAVNNNAGFFGFPFSTTVDPTSFDSLITEVRLASHLDGRFQYLGGLFYESVDEDYTVFTYWPGAPATNPLVIDPLYHNELTRDREQHAVFGEVSYAVTGRLTATVGGRYFEYDKNETNLDEGGFYGLQLGQGVTQRFQSSDGGSTFKANLKYKPGEDSLVYASWAEGFRLGRPTAGLPPGVCDPDGDGLVNGSNVPIAATRNIDSDLLESYEIGSKLSLLNRRVLLDATVYHIEWDKLPLNTLAGTCPVLYFANAGAASSDGVEVQASLFVAEGFRIDLGGGYTKAELTEDALALGAPEGARLPGSPRVNANLAAQYDFSIGGHRAFVRADSLYVGKFYGELQESPGTEAGSYFKLDARAGLAIRNFTAELFVRNLTNEDAFTWRGIDPSNTNPFIGYRLRPRTVGVQLGYSFE